MSLEELGSAIVLNRQIAYCLIVLMIIQIVADVVVFRMAILVLQRSKNLLDITAKHGEESDRRTARTEQKVEQLKASAESGILPPSIVPPEARHGCGPALSVLVGGFLFVGWMQGQAIAADTMRRDGEVRAAEWWAGQQADSR